MPTGGINGETLTDVVDDDLGQCDIALAAIHGIGNTQTRPLRTSPPMRGIPLRIWPCGVRNGGVTRAVLPIVQRRGST